MRPKSVTLLVFAISHLFFVSMDNSQGLDEKEEKKRMKKEMLEKKRLEKYVFDGTFSSRFEHIKQKTKARTRESM